MKKKPHQRQSVIKKVFSNFRNRLYKSEKSQNGIHYEIIKTKNGYSVKCHRERGAEETFYFKNKQEMNNWLKAQSS